VKDISNAIEHTDMPWSISVVPNQGWSHSSRLGVQNIIPGDVRNVRLNVRKLIDVPPTFCFLLQCIIDKNSRFIQTMCHVA